MKVGSYLRLAQPVFEKGYSSFDDALNLKYNTCTLLRPILTLFTHKAGADLGIFERGGPEAIIYKILERGGPKSLKMAFECSFQSLSYKSFANIPQKGGAQGAWAPPLNPSQQSRVKVRCGPNWDLHLQSQ